MAVTVRSVLNRVASLLNDEDFVRWPEGELVSWLNDGQRAIATAPATDAYNVRDIITTAEGSRQSLPDDGIRLIDVIRNLTDGGAVLQSDYATVNVLAISWRADAPGPAENYFYDERNPKEFEVYPPSEGGEELEIIYGAVPREVQASGNIIIADEFTDALINYIVYRALSKDTEDSSPDLGRATAFYRAFLLATGQKDAADTAVEPWRS